MTLVNTKTIEKTEQTKAEAKAAERVIEYADQELARMRPVIEPLMQTRHHLFELESTALDRTAPLSDQLYSESTYNDAFVKDDLGLRKGNTVEFHNETEKYDPLPSDTSEISDKKYQWRQAILQAAQELGFAALQPGESLNPIDKKLGIQDSTFEKVPGHVEAVIVAAAAGLSNHKRLRDAIRNIESGAINTDKIIITSCDRSIPDDEKDRVKTVGFRVGNTEFESSVMMAEDLLGAAFGNIEDDLTVPYGPPELRGKITTTQATIGERLIEISVISAPFDPNRTLDDNKTRAIRANTEETFLAAQSLLDEKEGTVIVESHDAWYPYQKVIAEQTFGLNMGKRVIATGPFNADRLFNNQEQGTVDIRQAEGVLDEMAKVTKDLVRLRIAAENRLALLSAGERLNMSELTKPIPSMEELRKNKGIYRSLPIDTQSELYQEPLVAISDYGIAGQSYYSRENAATIVAVPEAPKSVQVRESFAKTLRDINNRLRDPAITDFFGGEVELYVEEGVRVLQVQQKLYDEVISNLIRQQNPNISEEEVVKRRDQIIAKPSYDPESPAPHATGGAGDIILRYRQTTPDYVAGTQVPLGLNDGEVGEHINPDYFEYHTPTNPAELLAQRNRRAFYAIMTGAAFGVDTGLSINPTEIWHLSRGDQLAAYVSGTPAYYSFPPTSSDA